MTKNKLTAHTRILLIYLLIVAALCIMASCSPVKRVLNNEKYYNTIAEHVISSGLCVNETVLLNQSDTLITFDTLFALDYRTDTYTVDNEIVKTVYKTVVKTVAIRDTFKSVVTDNSRLDLQQKEISKGLQEQSKLLAKIVALEKKNSELRKSKNKAWTFFWIIVAAITAFILRKPLLSLVSPLGGVLSKIGSAVKR
jgi:regulator of replication initiation timing